ncbi:hypothetical protein GpartN1_g5288.t1 [Galdieria partita]|uniref:Uncharacterized protein n=1 Tax=Galdieria partita TaxID=83374 RepID=A0A9C7Q1K9_9RHOD|nr:hypothetical protein GpartN1_g5288.t1 [Galdieria partita]
MEEDGDRLTLNLLDSIDSYAAVQEAIAKRLADIMYLLAREKFIVRSSSERLDVLLIDSRPHPATLKCVQQETSLSLPDLKESWTSSNNLSTWNGRKWSLFTDIKENSETDLEEFCLSTTLKEAKRLSQNLTSLTLEAVNIQLEINHLLEKLSQYPPFSEEGTQKDILCDSGQDRLEHE